MNQGDTELVSFIEAICMAQEDAMAEDDTIVLLGQDIVAGFPFGATKGLAERFGVERVRNTPISEAATMGCGIGAAMTGLHPVIEVDFSGFLYLASDQLINNAAKVRYMSNSQIRVPLVVRVGQGPLGSFGAQHSASQHGWLVNTPGIAVCAPSNPQDAYDLMRWALVQQDPVVMAEDLRLYRTKGPLERGRPRRNAQPRAAVVRAGSDATAVCYGFGVTLALQAADELARDDISLEVLDLRVLSPMDQDAIGDSVRSTRRALCISDEPLLGGLSATLAAIAAAEAHGALVAPVLRLGARHSPAPYGAELERKVFPSAESIAEAVRRLVHWEETTSA